MSKSFLYNIKYLSKTSEINLVAGSVIFTVGSFCHGCYTYSTTKNNIITINKKYTFTRNGVTEFMIIDNNNKHYNVNNSVWFWKWDSIEDWHNIEINKALPIKYYGYRIPCLGLFPNIVSSNQNKILDSNQDENLNNETMKINIFF